MTIVRTIEGKKSNQISKRRLILKELSRVSGVAGFPSGSDILLCQFFSK